MDAERGSSADVLIDVRDLVKHYGPIRAVDGISFEVRRGDILGFLGPNGAGKTTAMQMITGFLEPDRGFVSVAGHDVASAPLAVKRKIGYLPETAPAYGEMTVHGFLTFVGEARDIEDVDAAIVGLAEALIHDPEVLILDEPTDGMDPNQKAVVQELISSLSSEKAIVLSTHILDEAERICNRSLIISQGRILVDSTPEALIARAPSHNVIRLSLAAEHLIPVRQRVESAEWCDRVEQFADTMLDIYPVGGENKLDDLLRLLEGTEIHGVQLQEGRLDELFREITKGIAA
ncbi:MAG: ATP-binding cassette domain-containing protein [Acidobacteriota bacterium]